MLTTGLYGIGGYRPLVWSYRLLARFRFLWAFKLFLLAAQLFRCACILLKKTQLATSQHILKRGLVVVREIIRCLKSRCLDSGMIWLTRIDVDNDKQKKTHNKLVGGNKNELTCAVILQGVQKTMGWIFLDMVIDRSAAGIASPIH